MVFLKKLWGYLTNSLRKQQPIPYEFSDNELILRAVFDPLFFSSNKNKFNRNVFLPPSKVKEDLEQLKLVSVFRRDYSTDHECKTAAVKIPIQTYVGFLTFLPSHIQQVNDSIKCDLTADLVFSPIGEDNHYIKLHGQPIFVDDKGVPMHAEIKYSKPLEPDNPSLHRIYADALLVLVKQSFHKDNYPKAQGWNQSQMSFIPLVNN